MEYVRIEGQVGDQRLERAVLLLKLLDAAQLGEAHARIFAFPVGITQGECLLNDAECAADLHDRRAGFGLAERVDDLLCGE